MHICIPCIHPGEGDPAPVRASTGSEQPLSMLLMHSERNSPIKHIIANQLRVRRPVLLVEHVLEVWARQDSARVVTGAGPRVESAALELRHERRHCRRKVEEIVIVFDNLVGYILAIGGCTLADIASPALEKSAKSRFNRDKPLTEG